MNDKLLQDGDDYTQLIQHQKEKEELERKLENEMLIQYLNFVFVITFVENKGKVRLTIFYSLI